MHPDPLEFLYDYDNIRDREIAGLVASSLAYGKVAQILKSVSRVLDTMGPSPFDYLHNTPEQDIVIHFGTFVHRFAKGDNLAALLIGIKQMIGAYGSLYHCFCEGYQDSDETIVPALTAFSKQLTAASGTGCPGHLMPCPDKGSACKRLNLFLRWMVRQDDVDPGGWYGIPAAKLIIPLDVHMFRISTCLGLTDRKQANMQTAVSITDGFRQWDPSDPVRYDFALTRFGIQNGPAGHAALKSKLGI